MRHVTPTLRAALLAALGLFLASPALAQANLITYGDFEGFTTGEKPPGDIFTGFSGGAQYATYSIVDTEAVSGSQSLSVQYNGGAPNFYDVQNFQPVTVTPGAEYTFSFQARTGATDGSGSIAYSVNQNQFGANLGVVYGAAVTDAWQTYEITFTVPDSVTQVSGIMQFGYANNEDGPIYIDDLSITQNAGPPPVGEDGLYQAPLAGANERPTPVVTDASGFAYVDVNGTTVTVTGSFRGLSAAYTASHIHSGAADETGPPVLTLTATVGAGDTTGTWQAAANTFTVRQSFADSIKSGLAYVNVHSTANPAGEIRGQIAPAVMADGLVINEVDSDTPGSDTAEFVELYNAGDADVTLDGHALVFFNGNGDVSYGAFDLTGTLAPGAYYVVGNPGVSNVDLTFDPGDTGSLQNGADAVALYRGTTATFPGGTAPSTTNLVDAVVYGTADPDDTDLLAALGQTTQHDEAANEDKDNESIQRSPDGASVFVTAVATPGAANYTEPAVEPVPFAFGFESLDPLGSWKNTSSEPGFTLSLSDDAVEGDSSLQVVYDFVADQSWGGSVDFGYAPEGGFVDLSGAEGIRFSYKTVTPVSNTTEVSFAVKLVDASAEGGADYYEARVPAVITDASGEWQELEIPFSSFTLPSWVTPQDPTFDLDAISAWEMQVVVGTPGVGNTYAGQIRIDGLSLFTTEPEPTEDLNANGGFESAPVGVVTDLAAGIDGWTLEASTALTMAPEFAVVDDVTHTGDRALRLTVNEAGADSWNIQAIAEPVGPVEPGETYVYSVWARSATSGATASFTVGNAAFSEYGRLSSQVLTDEWQEFTFQFTINDQETEIRAPIHVSFAGNVGNAIYIDDLSIQLAPEPAMAIGAARDAGVGETVRVVGTVTRTAGAFTYFQDATGGLTIRQPSGAFADSVASGAIAPGTVIDVTGTLSEFSGLLQINEAELESFEITGTAAVPAPQTVTLAELAANGEDYEGELVTVGSVTIDADGDAAFQARTTYQVTDDSDNTGAVTLRVPNAEDTTVDGAPIPPRANVTAIVGQFSSNDPATGYQLLVLDANDVQNNVASEGDGEAVLALTVANPVHQNATVRFSVDVPGEAMVALYDALGRRVATLAEGEVGLGVQTARLDAAALASGVYILRLEAETGVVARTITVVR